MLGESADEIVSYLVQREDVLLGRLSEQRGGAEQRVAEAQRVVDEARTELWKVTQTARWLMAQTDRHPVFGRGPAPTGSEPVPKMFSPEQAEAALARPWHRERRFVAPEEPQQEQELLEPPEDDEEDDDVLLEEGGT